MPYFLRQILMKGYLSEKTLCLLAFFRLSAMRLTLGR